MKWKIREIELKNQIVIAPMAGVTNQAYRYILKQYGAGLLYSEMISDKGLGHHNQRTWEMLTVNPFEKPLSLQLFGGEVKSMVEAAVVVDTKTNADIIDINMGCPVNKVIRSASGAKLMQDPQKIYDIVRAVVEHVKKPVTVKIRSGWDSQSINAVEIATIIENAGASAIAVHGRTRAQMYTGKADWDIIRKVKETVRIPVIGNGDINSPEEAKRMLDETNCDAIMIGRAILGAPWLIEQVNDYLTTGTYQKDIGLQKRKGTILQHIDLLIKEQGEKIAILEMRSHTAWYIKGLQHASTIKRLIMQAQTRNELERIVNDYFSQLLLTI